MGLETQCAVTVYQGEDKNINFRLANQDTGDAFDLTGATEIVAIFPAVVNINNPNIYLEKKLSLSAVTILNAGGGKFSVRLTAADTLNLAVGQNIDVEIRVTLASLVTVVQIPNAITILPSLFPTAP